MPRPFSLWRSESTNCATPWSLIIIIIIIIIIITEDEITLHVAQNVNTEQLQHFIP